MGTNYYVVKNGPSVEEPIHIGKSSYGWLFLFQAQNERWHEPPVVWQTWSQVLDWLQSYTVDRADYVIMDEYDRVISLEDFIDLVESKQIDEFNLGNPDNFSDARNVDGYRFTDREFS